MNDIKFLQHYNETAIDNFVAVVKQNILFQTVTPKIMGLATLSILGGLFAPNVIFLSSLAYFGLYQIDFVNDLVSLKGKGMLFKSNYNL